MLKESKAGHSERIKKIEAEIDGIREENRRLELRRDTLAAQSKRLRDESAANRELISGLQRREDVGRGKKRRRPQG